MGHGELLGDESDGRMDVDVDSGNETRMIITGTARRECFRVGLHVIQCPLVINRTSNLSSNGNSTNDDIAENVKKTSATQKLTTNSVSDLRLA